MCINNNEIRFSPRSIIQNLVSGMRVLVVYDSIYGNTGKIAESIVRSMGPINETMILEASQAMPELVRGNDLLIVGSPTHGGRPTPAVQSFLSRIPDNSLEGIYIAAFDTRMSASEQGTGLRLMMRIMGFAAEKIAKRLMVKGGHQLYPSEGFVVSGQQGPLKDGEIARALRWSMKLEESLQEMKLQAPAR